jgi:hypothetical protein
MARSYAPLPMVASVPMTPIFLVLVAAAAARAPGSSTPMTGSGNSRFTASRLMADAVLQATTSILISWDRRNCVFSKLYRVTVSADRMP